MECKSLPNCGFFKKHADNKKKELACKGFVAMYCRGEKQEECRRRKYKEEKGCPPPDDMLPNGQMISY